MLCSNLLYIAGLCSVLLSAILLGRAMLCSASSCVREEDIASYTRSLICNCDLVWIYDFDWPGDLQEDTYLDTSCPPSSSITTVVTFRDNKLVNLPWNLLVEGDIVLLGPSETAPTQIRQVISLFINMKLNFYACKEWLLVKWRILKDLGSID